MTIDLKAIRWRIAKGEERDSDELTELVCEDVPALLSLVDEAASMLLRREWTGGRVDAQGHWMHCCPACKAIALAPVEHVGGCEWDVILKRLGYPDQASRDTERVARERAKGYAASVHEMQARAFEAGGR